MTEMNHAPRSETITANKAMLSTLRSFLISFLVTAILIFGGAGRLDWTLGWLFCLAWLVPKLAFLLLLRWQDPDLLVERATRHADTKDYDRILVPVYLALAFATFLTGSLDGGRFRWSGELPIAVIALAYIVYLLGNGLAGWAMNANPFLSAESRIQSERGQYVVRGGPYRYVRHPTYLAAVILWPVTGPMLGSWWAVIPGVLAAATMLVRTELEDRMLRAELVHYSDYVSEVPYRLLPGIW